MTRVPRPPAAVRAAGPSLFLALCSPIHPVRDLLFPPVKLKQATATLSGGCYKGTGLWPLLELMLPGSTFLRGFLGLFFNYLALPLHLQLFGRSGLFYPLPAASSFAANHISLQNRVSNPLRMSGQASVQPLWRSERGPRPAARSGWDRRGRCPPAPGGISRQLCEAPVFLVL